MKALRVRLAVIAAMGTVGVLAALFVGADGRVVDLVALGSALVAGDLVELRPANRHALPIGFAIVLVLLRAASPTQFVVIVAAGSAAAVLLRTDHERSATRLLLFVEFLAGGLGAGAVYELIVDAAGRSHSRAAVLSAIAVVALVAILFTVFSL